MIWTNGFLSFEKVRAQADARRSQACNLLEYENAAWGKDDRQMRCMKSGRLCTDEKAFGNQHILLDFPKGRSFLNEVNGSRDVHVI